MESFFNQQEGARFSYDEQTYDNTNFNSYGAVPDMNIPNPLPTPFVAMVTQTQTVTQTTSYFVPLQPNFGFQEPQPQPQFYESEFNAGPNAYPDESVFQPQSGAVGFSESAPAPANPLDDTFFDSLNSLWDNVNGNVGGAASQNFGCDYEPQAPPGGSLLFDSGPGAGNPQGFEYDGALEYTNAFSAGSWPTISYEGLGQGAISEVVNDPFPDWSPEYIAEIQAAIAAAGPVKCEDDEEAQLYLQNPSEASGLDIDGLLDVDSFGALDGATTSSTSSAIAGQTFNEDSASLYDWKATLDMFMPQDHDSFGASLMAGNGALVYDSSSGGGFPPGEDQACMFLP